jgi:hypothetical protein
MLKTLLISMTAVAATVLAPASQAQVNPAFAEISEAVEQARTIVQTERKMLVMQNLALMPAQNDAFWKVYDEYAADMKKAGDRRVKVITDFAASYDTMSDQTAESLTMDYLKFQSDMLDLRKSYYRKFRKVIGATKTARLYQIENKLDAISNFALAPQIPLLRQGSAATPVPKP